jgi:AAA domain
MVDKNKDLGFPRVLLKQPESARDDYFRSYTVAHPKLREANENLSDAIREAIPDSLIFVSGPAGTGKTTLRLRTEQRIATEMLKELEDDPGRFPVIGINAIPPDSGNFSWKEFYRCILKKLDEPCINYKIKPNSQRRTVDIYNPSPLLPATEFREAAEQAIKHRRPAALLIDEAQHLGKMSSGRKLQDQLDSIKSLASATEIPIVLIGTYELLALRNLSGQLSRRSVDVHFRRYRAEHSDEVKAFKNVLWSFQNHLPLHEQPDLVGNWDYLYERSVGCVGVLKDWLTRALAKALKDGGRALSQKNLEKSALSISQCEKMLDEATEGEALLDDSEEDRASLRREMGLEARLTIPNQNKPSADDLRLPPRRKRKPGERNPKRDPIGLDAAAA